MGRRKKGKNKSGSSRRQLFVVPPELQDPLKILAGQYARRERESRVQERVKQSDVLQSYILNSRLSLLERVSSTSLVDMVDTPLTEVVIEIVPASRFNLGCGEADALEVSVNKAIAVADPPSLVFAVSPEMSVGALKAKIFGVLGLTTKRTSRASDMVSNGPAADADADAGADAGADADAGAGADTDVDTDVDAVTSLGSPSDYILCLNSKTVELHNEGTAIQSLPTVLKASEDGEHVKVSVVGVALHEVAVRAQLISSHIGALTGRMSSLEDLQSTADDEVTMFRRAMIPLIKDEMRNRKDGVYTLAPDVCSLPLPMLMAERLQDPALVRFHYMNTWESKTMKWDLLLAPAALLAWLFESHRKVLRDLPADADPSNYLLKAYGSADFYVGDTALADFNSVRRSLMRHDQIHVSIMSRVDAITIATSEVDEEDLLSAIPVPGALEFLHTEQSLLPREPDAVAGVVALAESGKLVHSLWDLMEVPFRLTVRGGQDIKYEVSHADKSLNKTTKRVMKLSDLVVYVEVSLYHGSVRLTGSQRTRGVLMNDSPRWDDVLKFDIDVADLPRSARACFSVYLASESALLEAPRGYPVADALPLGCINVPVLDHNAHLRTGTETYALWPFEAANPISTAQQNPARNTAPLLQVEFPAYTGSAVMLPSSLGLPIQVPPTPEPSADELAEVERLVGLDTVYELSNEEKDIVWRNRYHIRDVHPSGLAKLVLSSPYHQRYAVLELYELLKSWPPYASPLEALELLDAQITDTVVRSFAVDALYAVSDNELCDFMIQLVQALKNDNYHNSPLARFLIRRSLRSRRVGHVFFWSLKAEMHVPEVQSRFALYLEAYLRGCGAHRDELLKQVQLTQSLIEAAVHIKQIDSPTPAALREFLDSNVSFPSKVQLVPNPSVEVSGLVLDKCKFMHSKKMPLWLVFQNADGQGAPSFMIFKEGDDLRQDMLTLQMIRIMDKIWQQEDMDLRLKPYAAVSTGDEVGYIEVVLNSDTLANIQVEKGGMVGAFKSTPLAEYLRDHNPTEVQYQEAVENFIVSCAGYCVATFVLGIGDRHNDNIMLDESGHLFHIDFGHFLGNIKKKFGISRERTPFVFTPDMLYVMGGKDSPGFERFVDICCRAYNILRRHSNMFINLFAMMLSTGIPELQEADDIQYLRRVLQLDASEEEAAEYFKSLIEVCLRRAVANQVNFGFHNFVHSGPAARILKKHI